jgi:signal transduction histidine kinase
MTGSALPLPSTAAPLAGSSVDVSPSAISALIARGALELVDTDMPPGVAAIDARALLVSVTHDLRSPLGAMLLLIERLRSGHAGPLSAQQDRLLAIVHGAAVAMGAVATDALDLARGGHTLCSEPDTVFSPADLLATVRALAAPLAEERTIRVRISTPPLGRRIGNAGLLQRVLFNLVTNALKYTEQGAVTVTIDPLGSRQLLVSVIDTGSGLPEPLARCFARPGGLQATDIATGSVGLALCATLLQAVDSRLEYQRTEHGGSHFQFVMTLPPAA